MFFEGSHVRRGDLVRAVVLSLLLGFCFNARAENPFLQKATKAYERFDFEPSLSLLQQALQHADSTTAEKAKIHLYLGLVHFTLGDVETAEGEFTRALKLDREIEPPPDTSPKILARFEKIKESIPPVTEDEPADQVTATDADEKPLKTDHLEVASEPPRPAGRKRVWTWVLAGVGAATLAGGGVCGGLALAAKNDFEDTRWADEANGLMDTYETSKLAANILYGTGGAILASALILFFVEGMDADSEEGEEPAVVFAPTPAGIELSIRF